MRPKLFFQNKLSLYLLIFLSAVKALGLILIAESISGILVKIIIKDNIDAYTLYLGVLGVFLRFISTWFLQAYSFRVVLGVKENFRSEISERIVSEATPAGIAHYDTVGVGGISVLLSKGLNSLDGYYTQYIPALMNCFTIPLILGSRILFSDLLSAIIVAVTIPLIPIFMILIGEHTQDKISAATKTLENLSHYILELSKGLPILIGLNKATQQRKTIIELSNTYRIKTMSTLKIAFLSGMVLEIVATISVALVAVFMGTRLVQGNIDLQVALLVLLLVPDCYTPLREVGVAYHTSMEGKTVLDRIQNILNKSKSKSFLEISSISQHKSITVDNFSLQYRERKNKVFDKFFLDIPINKTTLLVGSSGSGKSTLLNTLAGLTSNLSGDIDSSGKVSGIDLQKVAWLGQSPNPVCDTVIEEMELYSEDFSIGYKKLEELSIEHLCYYNFADLSPGELRQVMIARSLVQIENGANILLLDEPTAHLDSNSTDKVINVLSSLSHKITIIIVTHQQNRFHFSDKIVNLSENNIFFKDSYPKKNEQKPINNKFSAYKKPNYSKVSNYQSIKVLFKIIFTEKFNFFMAAIFGISAIISGVALTSLSGWLIIRASEQPPILYLLSVIVGVRFFGLGKGVFRYFERIYLHNAMFSVLTKLRLKVWDSLSRRGLASRKLLQGKSAVPHIIGDIEILQEILPRFVLPLISSFVVYLLSIVAIGILLPKFLLLQILCGVVIFFIVPVIALWADKQASSLEANVSKNILKKSIAMFSAAPDLRANNIYLKYLDKLRKDDRSLTSSGQRRSWSQGLAQSLVILFLYCQTFIIMLLGAQEYFAGNISGPLLAGCIFLQLALMEPCAQAANSIIYFPVLKDTLQTFSVDINSKIDFIDKDSSSDNFHPTAIESLKLDNISARWEDMRIPVFSGLNLNIQPNSWISVSGKSGSGKSTLLAVILGFLVPEKGLYFINDSLVDNFIFDERFKKISWCPQDAYLFDSTLRENLLLGNMNNRIVDDSELLQLLSFVGLKSMYEDLQLGLDTRVGSGGVFLSGGQRRRLSVAKSLLSDSDVILLDEPTAHIDAEGSLCLMKDLRNILSNKIVIMVTHNTSDIEFHDIHIQLEDFV